MPPRSVTLAVVLFWLATTGWFLYREIRPSFARGEPPPFTIDLVDEARELKNLWDVLQNGERVGKAETWIEYLPKEDQFDLYGKFDFDKFVPQVAKLTVKNRYRVTRAGDFTGMATAVWILP